MSELLFPVSALLLLALVDLSLEASIKGRYNIRPSFNLPSR